MGRVSFDHGPQSTRRSSQSLVYVAGRRQSRWSFGQVVAVVLLAAPLITYSSPRICWRWHVLVLEPPRVRLHDTRIANTKIAKYGKNMTRSNQTRQHDTPRPQNTQSSISVLLSEFNDPQGPEDSDLLLDGLRVGHG